jgi:membrane-associated phospholipid phosphatase
VSFQTFMEFLASIDIALFRFINGTLYVRALAHLTYLLAQDQRILLFLLTLGVVYWIWSGWKKAGIMLAWSFVAILLSNLIHNKLLKLFFNRNRPFMTLPDVHLCVPLNDLSNVSLSFPSTHAASAAALAILAGGLEPRVRNLAWAFALVIGLGTIYSGGHYPADVLAGYGIGIFIGWGLYKLGRILWPQEVQACLRDKHNPPED